MEDVDEVVVPVVAQRPNAELKVDLRGHTYRNGSHATKRSNTPPPPLRYPSHPVDSWRFPHRIAKGCGKRHESTSCETGAVENLLGAAEIRELAARLGIKPTKALGQNFVIDGNTVRRILKAAALDPEDVVIEDGPGL